MSDATGKPGADILHEVIEAYQGALLSQSTGVSSPISNQPGTVYSQAHAAATLQSGVVTQQVISTCGMPMPALSKGNYQFPIGRAEWSVVNKVGKQVIIQKY